MLVQSTVPQCRAGIIPLVLNRDIGGPIGRTVTDVAKLFTALTDFSMFPEGYDPRDPVTAFRLNYTHPSNYTQFLNANGLQVCRCSDCCTGKHQLSLHSL
jgi:amidase